MYSRLKIVLRGGWYLIVASLPLLTEEKAGGRLIVSTGQTPPKQLNECPGVSRSDRLVYPDFARKILFFEVWHAKGTIEYHQNRLCGAKPRSVTHSVPCTTPSLLSETDVPTRHVPDGSRGCGKAQPGNRRSIRFRQRSIGYRSNIE